MLGAVHKLVRFQVTGSSASSPGSDAEVEMIEATEGEKQMIGKIFHARCNLRSRAAKNAPAFNEI